MDAGTLAVVGTLSGVGMTSVATLLAARLASRNQRKVASIQLSSEQARLDRKELREAFIEYLDAYDSAFGKAQRVRKDTIEQVESSLEIQTWLNEAPDEMTRLRRAYLILTITASADVRKAANECLSCIWEMGMSAVAADGDRFQVAVSASQQPRDRLREAMRSELHLE